MSDSIEIKIDGPKMKPDQFLRTVESFFGLVQGVSRNVSGPQSPVQWTVEVDRGSSVIRARPLNPSAASLKSIEAICQGVGALHSGVKAIPQWFTYEEIKHCRNLGSEIDGEGIRAVSIKNGRTATNVSSIVVSIADELLNSDKHNAFGSIEGKLDALSDREVFICTIYDANYHRAVNCYLQNPALEDEAIRAFRKRVLASGLIRYAKEGYPTSISVDSLRVFPDESELPTIEEVQAIYRQYS